MKGKRLSSFALAALTGGALLLFAGAGTGAIAPTLRWDIVTVNFATATVSAGGIASASAENGAKITLTGAGTFPARTDSPRLRENVTGGGTWRTFAPDGALTGEGTYTVTGFVTWTLAPGGPGPPNDTIGLRAAQRAGLVTLRIRYSDGSDGALVVSCTLPGSPPGIFEGIIASKGFIQYWNRGPLPAPPGDENRTLFHVIS